MEEKVLAILEENYQQYVSGEDMAGRLFVTRANIWKAIKKLRGRGYSIQSSPQKGYCLTEKENYISSYLVSKFLSEKTVEEITVLSTVDSTNNFAKALAVEGKVNHLVISEEQTSGKGRRERSFFSPSKSGLYMSVILHPTMIVEDVQLLTICAALSVCGALAKIYSIQADIKWLNDVYINGRKVCGILTEGDIEIEILRYKYIVVGIGINTIFESKKLPENITSIYTALSEHTNVPIDRNQLAAEVMNAFYGYYRALEQDIDNKKSIIQKYVEKSNVLGKKIIVNQDPDQVYTALDITEQGHLLVEDSKKEKKTLYTGDVSIKELSV